MNKILIILTGGTIGSSVNGDHISVDSDNKKYKLIELFKKNAADVSYETGFDFKEPYTLLSENLTGSYINKLIDCVKSGLSSKYDGIIITHGTDTLQYSAAALGLALNDINIPVLFVSSNYILEDSRSNGLNNFICAVKYIIQGKKGGVYVSYDGEILDSLTLLPHMAYSDKLYHVKASSKASENELSDLSLYKNKRLSETAPILYIKAVPGQLYPALNPKIKAVLLETYHSGTLCTKGTELTQFCEAAHKMNIPVYVTGIEERIQYESTLPFDKLHLIILKNESPVTIYMKLWFIYGAE